MAQYHQPSQKVSYEVDGEDYQDEVSYSQQQQQQQLTPSYGPGSCDNPVWYDPMNLGPEFSSGSRNVEAFARFKCVKGSSRRPCYYTKITCAQLNLGSYGNRILAFFDGLSQNSALRNIVLKKPIDGASPTLARFLRTAEDIETIEIIFVRKVPAEWVQYYQQDGQQGANCGNVGDGRIGACGQPCYGKCGTCRGRGDDDWTAEWEQLFPFRQATLTYRLYTSRITGFNQVAGEQCMSKPVGQSDCGSCTTYPSPLNPVTWGGTPGVIAGAGWHVRGTGVNFPDRPQYHGFGPLASDQLQIQFSSMETRVQVLHPFTGCYATNESEIIPI